MADRYDAATILAGIIDALRASTDLVDVQIEPGFPGDNVRAEAIYAGELHTDVEYPTYRDAGGRRDRFQTLTIPLEIRVASRHTLDAVNERTGEIVGAADDVIAAGLVLPGELDLTITAIDQFAIGTPDGHLGQALLTVIVKSSIS